MPFETHEYLSRIEETKRRMEAAGIEVLLVTDPSNMNYLTGYNGWSFYVHQLAALALDTAEPLWIGRQMDIACARHSAFLSSDSLVGYPEEYVQSAARHEMDFIAGVLADRGWGDRSLGVEMDSYFFTARAYEQLRLGLPDATFVDANLLVNWVRLVKSTREIEHLRAAGAIADRAMQAVIDRIEPGVRECDAAATFYATEIEGTPEFGGDLPSHVLFMPTGEKASAPHLSWTDNRFRVGEATNIELAGCRHRYHAGLARTVFLGSPPPRLTRVADVVVEGMEVALEKARPGTTCEQVEAAWRAVITKADLEKESRIGYSIGIGYPPDWGEHTASLRPGDTTVLEPDMTFHMILGMWMDNWGFELSETIRVTEDGAPESFSTLPRKLFVNT